MTMFELFEQRYSLQNQKSSKLPRPSKARPLPFYLQNYLMKTLLALIKFQNDLG